MVFVSPMKFVSFLLAGMSLSGSLAFPRGIDCPDISDRVFFAEEIVVGRTVKIKEVPDRPGMDAVVFEFEVQESLKGDLKAGEVIKVRFGSETRMKYMLDPFPMVDQGPAFVFLGKDREGNLSASCNVSVDEKITIPRMKHLIAVTANPLAHLDSKDAEDVCVVLKHVSRHYCQFDERRRGKAPAEQVDNNDLARVKAYLLAHCNDKGTTSSTAVNALAHLDPTPPDAFDVFAEALESSNSETLIAGAKGLALIRDRRAIPLLIERLARYRRDDELNKRSQESDRESADSLCRLGYDGWLARPRPEYELIGALMVFDDPQVSELALKELAGPANFVVIDKAAQLQNENTVRVLLDRMWENDSAVTSALCKMSDGRIVQQARERMYDHPQAPHLLACQGDPESKAFMLKLVRQGHVDGAIWAAETQNQEAKADLITGLDLAGGVPSFFVNDAAYALGRLRAFDLIERMLARPATIDTLGIQGMFLYGLANLAWRDGSTCQGDQSRECLHKHMRGVADREQWSNEELRAAEQLFDIFSGPHQFAESHDSYRKWTPPADLPDMPDPLDMAASLKYFEHNKKACQKALRTGNAEDQLKILQSAKNCKAALLDGELALFLLHGPDRMVRSRALGLIGMDRPALTQGEMQRWALSGDGYATSMALNYIKRHPKPEYAPIVVSVLRRGWHLFDTLLFEALIETQATEARDLLRAYLDQEHITLRANAAITLVHLEDDTAAPPLKDLLEKAKGSGGILSRYSEAALQKAEASLSRRP